MFPIKEIKSKQTILFQRMNQFWMHIQSVRYDSPLQVIVGYERFSTE